MATPLRTLRIKDADWRKIKKLADELNISASAWLLLAAQEKAALNGVELEGAAPEGNPAIATLNKKR